MKKNISLNVVNIILCFIMTWSLERVMGVNPGNIISVVLFLFLYVFSEVYFKRVYGRNKGEECEGDCSGSFTKALSSYRISSFVLAAVYTLFYILIARDYMVADLDNRMFKLGIIFISTVGLFLIFYRIILFLFVILSDKRTDAIAPLMEDRKSEGKKLADRLIGCYVNHTFLVTFILCLICYLPFFLYLFPGVMTPDSINQFEQVLGVKPLSNHHPIMHTLFMGLFYYLGFAVTGDGTLSAGFYTLMQLLFVCFGAAFTVDTLKRINIKWQFLAAVTLFYALIPYNGIMASTVWKDIPFAVVVTIFICIIIRMDILGMSALRCTAFGITGFFLCLLRSNGWFGFIALLPFIVFHYRKNIKKILITIIPALLLAVVVKYPVMNSLNIIQPDFAESLSVPLQQMAYVLCFEDEINYQDLQEIKKVVDLTYIRELYSPGYADNIKELVRAGDQQYLIDHRMDFLKMYIRWGIKYPGDFVRAYVNQTYGYYYPDRDYNVADGEGVIESGLDIHPRPFLVGKIPLKTKEIVIKLGNMVPMYSLIWCIGAVFWMVLFFLGLCLAKKEYQKMLWFLPCIFLVGTVLIATPLAYSMRYVYFMFFSMPIYPAVACMKNPTTADEKVVENIND